MIFHVSRGREAINAVGVSKGFIFRAQSRSSVLKQHETRVQATLGCQERRIVFGVIIDQLGDSALRYVAKISHCDGKEIQRQRAIIARFRSFNREKSIRAAESREKALARMELVDRPQEEKQTAFRFRAARSIHGIALEAEGLSKAFGDRVLFQDVDIILRGGDRAALIGPNGIGKTTLVRCLTGRETPDAGTVAYSPKADVGYYDQRQLDLSPDKDVLNEVWDAWVAPGHAPPRATVQAALANPAWKIEVVVTAAQR